MAETFEMPNGDTVVVESVDDGYVARKKLSFKEYVDENIMTRGAYDGWDYEDGGNLLRVAEWDDGMGFIIGDCIENAVEDENVEVDGISDGWLVLRDRR